jgi:succinyl-diaminopimelate desuccinylase
MKEIVSLTRELIRFRTMHSMPEEIGRCADFIEEYLGTCGARCRRIEHQGVPSILALPEEGFAPVLLMSHIDVVDGPEKMFTAREKDGKLFGRGSLDDKYAVALSLVLLKNSLQELGRKNLGQEDLPFGILITGDEEMGGHNGAETALNEIRAKFCIALDGGGLRKIVVKEKGTLRLRLVSRGKSAHGARPWLGENAIEKLMDDYGKIRPFFAASAPDHWHRTMNFSLIQGGKSVNQVPDYAEALFDIRYTEKDDMDTLLREIGKDIEGELVVVAKGPLFQGGDSPYLDLLLGIAGDAEVGFEHGASDARFLSDHDIKGIVWGGDGDQSQHSEEEHVNIESVFALYRYLDIFMKRSAAMVPGEMGRGADSRRKA